MAKKVINKRAAHSKKAAPPEHPAQRIIDRYIKDVLSKKIAVGKLEQLAVERHIRDLKNAAKKSGRFPYYFDKNAALYVIDFFSMLQHSKGKWAGQAFELAPWQLFIVWCLYGWRKIDGGKRRFKMAYVRVARKNGKSTLLAGIGLYMLIGDGENGAECYSAATKRDQATIIHGEARRMVKKSKSLQKYARLYKNNIIVNETESKFEPLGADADTMDGLNPHFVSIDELHAHKTRDCWDVLDSATGARDQPLLFAITTAGFNQEGICKEQDDYCISVLKRTFDDDKFFGFIASLDEGDDWKDPKNFRKANPNLGISIDLEELKEKAAKAVRNPREQNNFRVKRLNEWVSQEVRWLSVEAWDASKEPLRATDERACFCALDLANKYDINAFGKLWPAEDGTYDMSWRFWIPEDVVPNKTPEIAQLYTKWHEEGYLEYTEGDVTDYQLIQGEIEDESERNIIAALGYDPYNATQMAINLRTFGINVVEFNQNMKAFNEPSKKWEELVRAKRIRHGGNPIVRWMIENVSIKEDHNGNIRPVRPKRDAGKKVDGVVVAVMCLGLALKTENKTSVYEERGMREL